MQRISGIGDMKSFQFFVYALNREILGMEIPFVGNGQIFEVGDRVGDPLIIKMGFMFRVETDKSGGIPSLIY